MYCKQCGKELKEGAKFCEYCGTQNTAESSVENTAENPKKENEFVERLKTDKKAQHSLIGLIAVIVVFIVVFSVYSQSKKTINLEDYAKIQFTGYDEKGTASIDFDEEKFSKDVLAIAKNVNKDSSLQNLVDYYWLTESYDMELDKTSDLSNGDKVTLTFTYNNNTLKTYGVKFKGDKITEKVKGLKDLRTVDPFKDIEVEFSGVDGNVTVKVTNNSKDEYLKNLYYSVDKSDNISVGDKITVKLDVTEESAKSNGVVLKKTEKTFTCKSADKYVEKLSQIDENSLKELKKQSLDIINSKLGTDTQFIMGELNYEGMYLLNRKDKEDSWNAVNRLYVIYSTTIDNAEGTEDFATQTVYLPVRYSTVLESAEGEIKTDLQEGSIASVYNNIEGTWVSCGYGYFSPTDMYNDLVKSELAEYTYEISKNLQQFGN